MPRLESFVLFSEAFSRRQGRKVGYIYASASRFIVWQAIYAMVMICYAYEEAFAMPVLFAANDLAEGIPLFISSFRHKAYVTSFGRLLCI